MFIYTLPLFFTEIAWASPVELLMMVVAMLLVLFLSAPVLADSSQQLSLKNYLFSAWTGRVWLHWVFWPFFYPFKHQFVCRGYTGKNGLVNGLQLG